MNRREMEQAIALADQLVVAEIEDVLIGETDSSGRHVINAGYGQAMAAIVREGQHMTGHVLIEAAALAAEAIIRLAESRSEDPQATLRWLRSTEWTHGGER